MKEQSLTYTKTTFPWFDLNLRSYGQLFFLFYHILNKPKIQVKNFLRMEYSNMLKANPRQEQGMNNFAEKDQNMGK